ncbi:MAG: hypothetical protein AAF204_05430 [Pseudomonadota bacterium]
MGFCLFENVKHPGKFFAINPSYVTAVKARQHIGDRNSSLIELSIPTKGFQAHAFGTSAEIEKILMQGSKIGFDALNVTVLAGVRKKKPQKFRMTNANKVVALHEVYANEVAGGDGSFLTASQMFAEGQDLQYIVERPGVFAMRANANDKVPTLLLG